MQEIKNGIDRTHLVIVGLLIKFCLNIIWVLILLLYLPKIIKYNKIRYIVLNKFAKTYGLYILIALINLIFLIYV